MKLDEIPDHEMKNDKVKESYLADEKQFSSEIDLYNNREMPMSVFLKRI
ncbi:hypothetical protein [uncultured Fructobacillus sp.]|nr:hypothetical protein [uncultured Fructobacillus sp.]